MKRNSKGMLSIFVMAILALSFALTSVSVFALLGTPNVSDDTVNVGQKIMVYGAPGDVTSGATIKVYWDIAIGDNAWLLNTTEGNPDGNYSCQITVPDTINGSHYVWVEDTATASREKSGSVKVSPKLKPDYNSGLPEDEIELTGTGFAPESDVYIGFWNTSTLLLDLSWVGDNVTTDPSTVTTDEYGTFVATVEVADDAPYSLDYIWNATDEDDNTAQVDFRVGASITLDIEEGPEGTVVEVSGVGFNDTLIISGVDWDGATIPLVGDNVDVPSSGEFTLEIVVPSTGEGEHTIMIEDIDTTEVSIEFTVDGVATIEVSPTYGSPGATITLNGYNFTQIAGTQLLLGLNDAEETSLGDVDTEADGTFETTFVSPAITFGTYDVWANDTTYGVNASDVFKVGIIAFIINPTYGESGTEVGITGIGFKADSTYNLTFGDKLYEDYGDGVTSGEAISDPFFVPNVEPGTYDLTVIDEDKNELTVQFRVTESTYVSMDPPLAPNDYNVTIKGYNFADVVGTVDFVIYNSTDEWALTVWKNATSTIKVKTNDDGNFTGLWEVLPEADLSLGDYTVNVTGSEGLFVQVTFSVVEARVSVAPRKAQFDRGDSIQFNIKNDFKLPDAYIEIYDPSDTLYWSTEEFEDGWWLLVEGLYTVPYYRQTAALNPMELQNDAPMGAWLYIFYDNKDDQLMNGTFAVGPSTAAQVDEKLTEMWGSIEDLTSNIDDITSEIGDDIDALSGEIDDVVADVQDMIDDITADLAGELAQVAEDTEAAVSDIRDDIGDLAGAQADLASELESISQDTTDAKVAAEEAQSSAQGLTTLVYGAIGASLIAALAAIVSLMQISKKIA